MSGQNQAGREDVIRLMKEHGFPDDRIKHSIEAADLALKLSDLMIADGLQVDKGVVEKGALLHDIGFLRVKGELVDVPGDKLHENMPSDQISHPMLGAAIAEEWGFSDEVASCVLRHNPGFTVEQCKLLKISPIPKKDCAPVTNEERIVHYADHLLFFKELKLNPVEEPQAPAKAFFPWLKYYFMERANTKIGIDHPLLQREVLLNKALNRYVTRLPISFS